MHLSLGWATTGALVVQGIITELRSLNILSMEIMHLSLGWATTGALVVQGIITE